MSIKDIRSVCAIMCVNVINKLAYNRQVVYVNNVKIFVQISNTMKSLTSLTKFLFVQPLRVLKINSNGRWNKARKPPFFS